VQGDPYVALTDLAERIVRGYEDWDYDLVPTMSNGTTITPVRLLRLSRLRELDVLGPVRFDCVRFRL
jgi:hypothetical protein